MTDLFDRVAARALGLGMALRPRTRSRFEQESLNPGYEDVAAAFDGEDQAVVPPPAQEEGAIEPQFGAETAARQELRNFEDSHAGSSEQNPTVARERQEEPSIDLPPPLQTRPPDKKRPPQPGRRQAAALGTSPEPVDATHVSSTATPQSMSGRNDVRLSPAGMPPNDKYKQPVSRGANAGPGFDRLDLSGQKNGLGPEQRVASSPVYQPSAHEPARPSAPATDQAALLQGHKPYSGWQEPEHADQGQPTRGSQTRTPAWPVAAQNSPNIEITIGRLEIRAEPSAPAGPGKAFQPHLDLAAYRARRKGAP